MKPLPYDPRFKHVSYHETDLRTTFARIRREQAAAAKAKAAAESEKSKNIQQLRKKA